MPQIYINFQQNHFNYMKLCIEIAAVNSKFVASAYAKTVRLLPPRFALTACITLFLDIYNLAIHAPWNACIHITY